MSDRSEKRRYIRLDTAFPVNFCLTADGSPISAWKQGFTSDISKSGICLSAYDLDSSTLSSIKSGQIKLNLKIRIPVFKKAIEAIAVPAWIKRSQSNSDMHLIGLSYSKIGKKDNNKLVHLAWTKFLLPKFSLALIIILTVAFSLSTYVNFKLVEKHKNTVSQLYTALEDSKLAKQYLSAISNEKNKLSNRIQDIQLQLEVIKHTPEPKTSSTQELPKEQSLENELKAEQKDLEVRSSKLAAKQNDLKEKLIATERMKKQLLVKNYKNMYQWLKKNQQSKTGLVASYQSKNANIFSAYTYDQALLVCLYSYFEDYKQAKKILDFFKNTAQKQEGGFLNAYYPDSGSPAEYTVHAGPNIWLGIAAIQYSFYSEDQDYMQLAKDIAAWTIKLQSEDGGISGGQGQDWYSTEHNLDAYAFFKMMAQITGNKAYQTIANNILSWLDSNIYHHPKFPVKRGKNDLTVATDAYAWSLAALSPEKLEIMNIDTDIITNYVLSNCAVQTNFVRPSGEKIEVKGFDFTAKKYLKREPAIACEWTGHMILSLKIMKNFKEKTDPIKTAFYEEAAEDYLWHLSKLIIASPSNSHGQGRGCLPYASESNIDTYHGWDTPAGNYTGSVSATSYALLAYHGFNPFELKKEKY